MFHRRTVVAALGALALTPALATSAHAANQQAPAAQESANPINDQGSNYNYRSNITAIAPHPAGLQVQVLEFADRLLLSNHTGATVTVYGYSNEPYARVLANGTVELNTRSPAYYLNQNFYGQVTVPPSASASAPPQWTVVDRTGELEWHDHRIHWMSPVPPAQVKDKSKRTKIFDWQVPIKIGAQAGAIDGQLFWMPEEGTKTPVLALIALAAIVLGGLAFVLFVRRRRRLAAQLGGGASGALADDDGAGGSDDAPHKEAW